MSKEQNMPTFEFEKLLNDEQEVYKWLRTLISETGITKIENTPKEKGQLLKLSERVGYLMQLSYGLVSLFHVEKVRYY
jgi:isopenicillin N synthase-like dioxygenase